MISVEGNGHQWDVEMQPQQKKGDGDDAPSSHASTTIPPPSSSAPLSNGNATSASSGNHARRPLPNGCCFVWKVEGEFSRRTEHCWRVGITLLLSLTFSTYSPIADHLQASFLCPVLAVLACQQTVGASIQSGWQIAKGVFYAALFGWICQLCGVGYANDTRVATTILLFLFTLWAKYFINGKELTTKKLAVGLNATILITQLNYNQRWDYPWQILATSCLGSACGIFTSLFPFPRVALVELEERWKHGLGQTSYLMGLIIEGFTCTSSTEVKAKMIGTRIEQTANNLLANREAMKKRMKDMEYEFPVLLYRFFCSTYNNYTLTRLQQHFHTFDHLYRYLKCLAFVLQGLPYDAFHNACSQYLKAEMKELGVQVNRWCSLVASTDSFVHRSSLLDACLRDYSTAITGLFEKYLQFRADMFFGGKLWLIDLENGKKAVLRKGKKEEGKKNSTFAFPSAAAAPTPAASSAAAGLPPLHPPPMARSRSGESTKSVVFHDDEKDGSAESTDVVFHLADKKAGDPISPEQSHATTSVPIHSFPVHASSTNESIAIHVLSESLKQQLNDDGAKNEQRDEPYTPQAALDFSRSGGDFTWTSEDLISLNFFMFQLNEFTRRSLKFRREPYAADPLGTYHLGSIKKLPRFVWNALKEHAVVFVAELRASCRWDSRLFIESLKLAVALMIASVNELVPKDWSPIYQRTHHGWWAPVTVAFTMADSLGGHFSTMVLRVLGTFVGAVIGYILAKICQGDIIALIASLTVWNAATTYVRSNPSYGYAHLVAGFTAIVVAVGSDPVYGSVSEFAFVRIQETLIGVIVGMVIHNMVLPQHASALLHSELLKNIRVIRQAFEYSFGKYQNRAGVYTTQPDVAVMPNTKLATPPISPAASSAARITLHKATSSTAGPIDLTPTIAPVKLEANHAFSKLGPQLFSSLDTQTILCDAALMEPVLWQPKFPHSVYSQIIAVQRTISLYLYCMDLSLQRIIQSGSMYLMPDLDQHFTRLKSKVVSSLYQIQRKLKTYSGATIEEDDRQSSHTPDGSPMQSVSPIAARLRAHSHVTGDELLGLASSLMELETRYKTWIDQRILAKRNQIKYAEEADASSEEPGPSHARGRSDVGVEKQSLLGASNDPSHDHGELEHVYPQPREHHAFLIPIPLDTPRTTVRRALVSKASHSLDTNPFNLDDPAAGASTSPNPADPSVSVDIEPPIGFQSMYVPAIDQPVRSPRSGSDWDDASPDVAKPPLARLESSAGLAQMDVTFTRSMDVLALNTFLFSTRGLIREIISLSQSVRVLMHLRHPGKYEVEY